MRGRVRRDNGEVRQLENAAVENECKGGCKVRQPSWQQHRGDDNDERIEEIQRAVYEGWRSEEHTSELQSRLHLVCRLLLEKKKQELTPSCFLTTLNFHSLSSFHWSCSTVASGF